jgi:hypothetical protein
MEAGRTGCRLVNSEVALPTAQDWSTLEAHSMLLDLLGIRSSAQSNIGKCIMKMLDHLWASAKSFDKYEQLLQDQIPDANSLLPSGVTKKTLLKLNNNSLVWDNLGPYLPSDDFHWGTYTKMPIQYFPSACKIS